ncbi:MAG: MBOAT family protein, partial [Lachnospiraceae bacterium]|nr:MBOAT family protein [Lachnospiraceae bacterium]
QDAFWIISRLFWDIGRPLQYLQTGIVCLGISPAASIGMLLSVMILAAYDLGSLKGDVIRSLSGQKFFVRWPVYVLFLVVIALFAPKGVATEFIYFQF